MTSLRARRGDDIRQRRGRRHLAYVLVALAVNLSVLMGSAVPASSDGYAKASETDISYAGGPVILQPTVVLVFWGTWWCGGAAVSGGRCAPAFNPSPNTPDETRREVERLFDHMSGSYYQNILSQYCDSAGHCPSRTVATHSYIDAVNDYPSGTYGLWSQSFTTRSLPRVDAALALSPTANSIYVLITSLGTLTEAQFPQCAIHGANLPNSATLATVALDTSCANGAGIPRLGSYATYAASHEYAEAVTDPRGDKPAYHLGGNEVADVCNAAGWVRPPELGYSAVDRVFDKSTALCAMSRGVLLMPPAGYGPGTVNGAHGVEVFLTGQNSGPYHAWCCWTGWNALPGVTLRSAIVVGTNFDGRMEAFAVGTDGALHGVYQTSRNGPWSSWYSLGHPSSGVLLGRPAVARNADGRLEVFVRDNDGGIYHAAQTCKGCGWGAWAPLGGWWQHDPVVNQDQDGRLDVFAVGNDTHLYHKAQLSANSGWPTSWSSLSGTWQGQPSVIRNIDGRLEVFLRGTTNQLYHAVQTCAGCAGWSGWVSLGGNLRYDPSAAINADGRLEVFSVAADSAVWGIYEKSAGGNWATQWYSLGGQIVTTPMAIDNDDGHLEVFGIATDHRLWHTFQNCPGCGWAGWRTLTSSDTGHWNVESIAPPTNLVANGSFELGNTSGWALINPSGGTTNFQIYNSGRAENGTWWTETNVSRPAGSIFQDVAVTPVAGRTYRLCGYVGAASTTSTVSGTLALWFLGSNNQSPNQQFTVGHNWTQLCVSGVAPSGETHFRAQIYVATTAANLDLDNFALTDEG